jgi:hypothetical protein
LVAIAATAIAAPTPSVAAQASAVSVSGKVLDQHGKPPIAFASGAALYFMSVPADPDQVSTEVASAVIDKDGRYSAQVPAGAYQLTLAIPEQWAVPDRITVDASGPDPVTRDVPILAQDVTLQGQIGGPGLDGATLQGVDVQLWTYNRNAGLNYKRDGAHYSLKVGPGAWKAGQAEYHAGSGREGRIDALYPINVEPAGSTVNWTLPTFSFSEGQCSPPGVCALTVTGNGWLPNQPVDIYVVAFGKHELTDSHVGPVLSSPSDVDRFQGNLVGTVSADDRGEIAGAVDGTTAATFPPPILLEDTVYSFEAVQHVNAAFKVAQPAGGLDLPPFDTFITIGTGENSTVTVQEGDPDAP